MDYFIAVCGFIGSWLLVAGPLYQAALELHDEDIETEHIKAVKRDITVPPTVSIWWWLLPPVKVALERRRSRTYRSAYLKALSEEDVNALVSFLSKATAWLFVATGGLLLAVKETYELVTVLDISEVVFWVGIVVMPALSIGNVIFQVARSKRLLAQNNS